MLAFAGMLVSAAKSGGISVPPNCEEYVPALFPHWHVFLKCQLCQPMPHPYVHFDNAKVIAGIPLNKITKITMNEIFDLGFQVGLSSPLRLQSSETHQERLAESITAFFQSGSSLGDVQTPNGFKRTGVRRNPNDGEWFISEVDHPGEAMQSIDGTSGERDIIIPVHRRVLGWCLSGLTDADVIALSEKASTQG